jgi:activating signal cointegrator complex subunit 2
MEKHAFRGNEKGLKVHVGSSSGKRGRGRGGPRGSHGKAVGVGAEVLLLC